MDCAKSAQSALCLHNSYFANMFHLELTSFDLYNQLNKDLKRSVLYTLCSFVGHFLWRQLQSDLLSRRQFSNLPLQLTEVWQLESVCSRNYPACTLQISLLKQPNFTGVLTTLSNMLLGNTSKATLLMTHPP